jgi:hypothetical protein
MMRTSVCKHVFGRLQTCVHTAHVLCYSSLLQHRRRVYVNQLVTDVVCDCTALCDCQHDSHTQQCRKHAALHAALLAAASVAAVVSS